MIYRQTTGAAGLLAWVAFAGPAFAALPEPVAAMIGRAAEADDPAVLASVVSVARALHPEDAAEIDALAKGGPRPAAEVAAATPAVPPPPPTVADPRPPWKGSIELGGSLAQGKHDTIGAYGSLEIRRTGEVWSHRLTSRSDYRETEGRTTTERFSLAYEPRVRLSPSRYVFGIAQYEHDRTLGYANRYTLGSGLGLKVADRPELKVAVDFGPALRVTEHYERDEEAALAGRGSVNIRWLPSERITVSQEGDLYAESDQASAKSITALETLLFGPLKARLSYNVHYERNALRGESALDTVTRASLLYSF